MHRQGMYLVVLGMAFFCGCGFLWRGAFHSLTSRKTYDKEMERYKGGANGKQEYKYGKIVFLHFFQFIHNFFAF